MKLETTITKTHWMELQKFIQSRAKMSTSSSWLSITAGLAGGLVGIAGFFFFDSIHWPTAALFGLIPLLIIASGAYVQIRLTSRLLNEFGPKIDGF